MRYLAIQTMDALTRRRAVQHRTCALDASLPWDARVWHAAMYERITGQHVHVYVSAGVS